MKASVQILSSRPVAYSKGERKGEVFAHQCECFAVEPVQGIGVLMVNIKLAEPLLQEVDTVDANGNRTKQRRPKKRKATAEPAVIKLQGVRVMRFSAQ